MKLRSRKRTTRMNRYTSSLSIERRFLIKIILQMILLAVFVFLFSWIWFKLTNPRTLPFHRIKIVSTFKDIEPRTLKNVVSQHINGGFFSLNVGVLRQNVLQLPWVADVSVRQVWPDTLVVTVKEQRAIARWGYQALINANGEIFQPAVESIPMYLPLLQGPKDSQAEVLKNYRLFNYELSKLGLSVSKLEMTPRLAWRMELNNHICILLGREDINRRFARFIRLYPRIIGSHASQVESIDLRYSNGFAVQWK